MSNNKTDIDTELEGSADVPCSAAWLQVSESSMPELGQIAYLWDGKLLWVGGRADTGEGWLWGHCYSSIWHNGEKWDCDIEEDGDYSPTHWMPLPKPPNVPTEPRHE